MHLDPVLPTLVAVAFAMLLLGMVFHRVRLPLVVAYVLAGVAIGPQGLAIAADVEVIRQLGDFGIILLLFFLGLEMSLPRILLNWRVAILGTAVQIAVSLAAVLGIGALLGWPLERGILLGFVISLSSTAVVIPLLRDRGEMKTRVADDVLGILLVQDMALVPMIMVLGTLAGDPVTPGTLALQALGAAVLLALVLIGERRAGLHLPFGRIIAQSRELQVFAAFTLCFGLATLSGVLGLSTAAGAFVAGILVSSAKETHWVQEALEPFRVLLLAFFFLAVGALLDLRFVWLNVGVVAGLAVLALASNTAINAAILRVLGRNRRDAVYGGALLSQIGEFSFVLAALGYQYGVVTDAGHQTALAVISLTLLLSPLWVIAVRRPGRQKAG